MSTYLRKKITKYLKEIYSRHKSLNYQWTVYYRDIVFTIHFSTF